ncbi:MAG: cobalamin biosynthesis protein CobD, partial [Deltaproteobacteria bacterium]
MPELPVVLLVSFLLDVLIGDPRYRGHPVRLIGRGIVCVERILRGCGLDGGTGGIILVILIQGASLGLYGMTRFLLHRIQPTSGILVDLFLCYSCLALTDLFRHVSFVMERLCAGDPAGAREAVGKVVGRDALSLDGPGISRAATETLAENFVDGFLSPVFWYALGGALGGVTGVSPVITAVGFMLAFKVTSTLDSMVGYRTPAYRAFGRAAARLDDVMNFVPARLSFLFLFAGACLTGLHPLDGVRTGLRDRMKHASPNSAHAEAFAAGALHVRLGGPVRYADG